SPPRARRPRTACARTRAHTRSGPDREESARPPARFFVPLRPRVLGEPRVGELFGGDERGDGCLLGVLEDAREVILDSRDAREGDVAVVSGELERDVDEAAGVDDEVGRIKDATRV